MNEAITKFILIIIIAAILMCVPALLILWVWNWVLHGMFDMMEIEFMQAYGLCVVFWVLRVLIK